MKRLFAPLLACVVTLGAAAMPVCADEFDDAIAAYKSGQPGLAAKTFRALAEKGGVEAQYNLAILYNSGIGLPQSQREALYWAWSANLGGVRQAGLLIGKLSEGVSPTIRGETAARLGAALKLRMDLGDTVAMLGYARVLTDLAPDPDDETAYVWQAIAAALGAKGAMQARDATLAAMALQERLDAQDRTVKVFLEWCGMAKSPPTACDAVK